MTEKRQKALLEKFLFYLTYSLSNSVASCLNKNSRDLRKVLFSFIIVQLIQDQILAFEFSLVFQGEDFVLGVDPSFNFHCDQFTNALSKLTFFLKDNNSLSDFLLFIEKFAPYVLTLLFIRQFAAFEFYSKNIRLICSDVLRQVREEILTLVGRDIADTKASIQRFEQFREVVMLYNTWEAAQGGFTSEALLMEDSLKGERLQELGDFYRKFSDLVPRIQSLTNQKDIIEHNTIVISLKNFRSRLMHMVKHFYKSFTHHLVSLVKGKADEILLLQKRYTVASDSTKEPNVAEHITNSKLAQEFRRRGP